MNSAPKISFIIPVYNVEPYLARCLDSIVSQNCPKEIILIDDGSRDNSFAIAQDYQSRYKEIFILKQHNSGVSAARNAGLRLARGKYVYFADSDDVILERNLHEMVKIADENQIDWLKGLIINSYDDGRPSEIRPPESAHLIRENQFSITSGFQHLHEMLSKDWLPHLGTGFFRRDFLQKHGLWLPENIKLSEDSFFITQILTASRQMRVMEVSRPFYEYCRRANSASTRSNYLAGLASLFEVGEKLQTHYDEFIAKFAQTDELTQQTATDILRVMAVNYAIAYRYQYLRFDDETKNQARQYFTPEIIAFMQQFLSYKVVL